MKKSVFFTLLMACIMGLVQAQTITTTGTVKSSDGDPLHFAFVQDKQYKHGTFTDSLGNFTLVVSPDATLRINCAGYMDTLIKVNNQTNFSVVLKLNSVNITASATKGTAESASNEFLRSSFSNSLSLSDSRGGGGNAFVASQGTSIPVFQPKGETVGSRYFFKGWVHGYVVNSKDSIVQSPAFQLEYDKIGGALLLTKDNRTAIEVDRDLVKSFTLYDNMNRPYTFERVPQIDNNHYVIVIASGNKYKIYKAVKTNFVKSNYATDGLTSSGNNYDEYVDDNSYYVYDVKTNTLQKIALKKKALKDGFTKDADRLNKFVSDHSSDTIDDFYLNSLGSYMNE
jgi:hypothetical protein